MADKIAYKIRHIRMADKTWEKFKQEKRKSGKSWNLYLLDLLTTIHIKK